MVQAFAMLAAALDMRFDSSGWALDPVLPLARRETWSLFSADTGARLDEHLLGHAASELFGGTLQIEPKKDFSKGAKPSADRGILRLRVPELYETALVVRLMPVERAALLTAEALRVAGVMGGAGMDSMVKRARKLIQIETSLCDRQSLSLACLLSRAFLGAILPPHEDALFGIKGARERLSMLHP